VAGSGLPSRTDLTPARSKRRCRRTLPAPATTISSGLLARRAADPRDAPRRSLPDAGARGTARFGRPAQRPVAKGTPLRRSAFSGSDWGERRQQACASRALSSASYDRSASASLASSRDPSPPTLANPGSSANQASPLWLSRKSRKTTRDLKPAPWGGFGYTRTREISDPKTPRNQNPKRDSSKALKRRFSQTVIHLAARG